jgi:hypothetical protein
MQRRLKPWAKYVTGKASGFGLEFRYGEDAWVYDYVDNMRNLAARTKGLVLSSSLKTASRYILKELDGSTYMFFEWKSGDYTLRGMKPKYYVLKKAEL